MKAVTQESDESSKFSVYSSDGEDDLDAECLFCGTVYSKDGSGEEWVKCTNRWAHENCGAEDVNFICPMCDHRSKKSIYLHLVKWKKCTF